MVVDFVRSAVAATTCTAQTAEGSCTEPLAYEVVGQSDLRRGACEPHLLACIEATFAASRALFPGETRHTLTLIDCRAE